MELFGRIRKIRICGLVGGSISLEVGFEVSKAHARPRVSLSLLMYQDVELSATASAPRSPALCYALAMMIMD